MHSSSPRDALNTGIATVYQDLAMIPLMGISRNFFLGAEPTRGWGPFRRFDTAFADRVTREELARIGIQVRETSQPVGTLSGGERQSVAIARAVYFGARVLILKEKYYFGDTPSPGREGYRPPCTLPSTSMLSRPP